MAGPARLPGRGRSAQRRAEDLTDHARVGHDRHARPGMGRRDALHRRKHPAAESPVALAARPRERLVVLGHVPRPEIGVHVFDLHDRMAIQVPAVDLLEAGVDPERQPPGPRQRRRGVARPPQGTRVHGIREALATVPRQHLAHLGETRGTERHVALSAEDAWRGAGVGLRVPDEEEARHGRDDRGAQADINASGEWEARFGLSPVPRAHARRRADGRNRPASGSRHRHACARPDRDRRARRSCR
jgi:hypothetical protein